MQESEIDNARKSCMCSSNRPFLAWRCRKANKRISYIPSLAQGTQPMTATEEELDYEIRWSRETELEEVDANLIWGKVGERSRFSISFLSEEEKREHLWKTRFSIPDKPSNHLLARRLRRKKVAIAVSVLMSILIIVAIALIVYFGLEARSWSLSAKRFSIVYPHFRLSAMLTKWF